MTVWRRNLLALAVSVGMAASATLAIADGPSKGDWPNIPWTWQGLYAGVHIGNADTFGDDGLVFGAQIGRNWQSGKVVYGIEGDISFSGNDSIDWMGTARGRLGYLITSNILLYGTAGVGFVNFSHHGGGTDAEFVAGVGIEGKLTQTTTVRLEYLNFSDSDIDVVRVGLNFKLNW